MRAGLTFLAIALIAALFAAIAAPYFVDWTGQRALIEAAFKRATGIEASFPGAIDLTFLPSPRLRAEKAVLTGGGVSIAADEIEIEASLPRLLGGSPRLNAVRLVAPQIRLGPAPAPNGVVAAISVDALDVSNASIVRVDRAGGEEILVAGADFNGALDSLAGPVSGRFALTGSSLGALTGQVTIGALFKGSAPLQVSVAVPAPKMHVTFTGDVAGVDGWLGDAKRAPTLKGKVEAVGAVDVLAAARAWSANANLSLTAADFALTGLVARLGASGQGLEMQGEAKGRITGAPALSLTLRAKNLDLDRTFHEKAKTAAEPLLVGRELARMAAALGAALVDLDLGADAVTVGGQSLPNAALRWRHDGPVSANVTAKIDMPGSSAAGADGVLTLGASPTFVGKGRFKAEDFARWADWVNAGSAPGDAMRLGAGLGLHGFSAEGDFSASQTEVSGKDLHVLVGGAAFRGPMGWSFASEGAPARLTADLAGARLDLHALPDLSGLRDAMGGVDLALSIQADAVHFARVGEAELGAGGFAVKLQKTADALSIERLSLKDFGGATLEARGAADAKSAHFDGRLDAKSLGDLIALAAQALPSAASPWLAARAGALSPASAKFSVDAKDLGAMAAGDFASLSVEGATGAFSYSATRPAGAQALSVKMKANEGEKFIAMLSPGAQIPALGPLSANLDWVTGAAETARVNLSVTGAVGEFTWNAQGDPRGGVGLAGIAKLRVARPPSALALVWRGAAPAGADGPLQLNGQLALGPEGGLLEGLAGSLGDDKVTGAVKLNFAQAAPPGADVAIVKDAAAAVGAPEKGHRQRIEGALSFDALNLAAVAQLALSPTAPAANLYDGPDFAIDFAAKSAASPGGAMLQDFKARLTGKLGSIEVADAAATLNGGRISGAANLNRSDGVLSVSGEAAIKQVALPPPFAQGVADIALKFATTGRSAAQLVSGLSGGGTAALANAKIAKADPSALQRLLKRAVGQDAAPDEAKLLQALGGELDKGALALAEQTVPATLSGGALNVGPAPTPLADGALEATGRFDFGTGALSARIQVIDLEKLKFWRDAPPGFSALYTSGADGVKRQIDVASLASGLSAQALAVSLERTAMFDADIRERAYFVRRDKAEKFIARRRAELAAFAAEAARLAAQADPLLVQSAPAPELNAATPQAPPVQGADPAVKSKPTKGAAAAAPDLNGLY